MSSRIIISILACAFAAALPHNAVAQADDPAVQVCEAREKPRPHDPTYRRISAPIRKNVVDLVFETGTGGAVKRHSVRCYFEQNARRAWQFVSERKLSDPAGCSTLSERGPAPVKGQQTSATERCRDVMKSTLHRQAFGAVTHSLTFPGFTYPIAPDATRLRP